MGLPPNYIHKWRQGREPSLGFWIRALDAYGYDVMSFPPGLLKPGPDGFQETYRALERFKRNGWTYDPAVQYQPINVEGEVSAGDAQFREVPGEPTEKRRLFRQDSWVYESRVNGDLKILTIRFDEDGLVRDYSKI